MFPTHSFPSTLIVIILIGFPFIQFISIGNGEVIEGMSGG